MTNKRTDRPTAALYAANIDPAQFIKEHLKISYATFRYRMRNGRLTLADYHKILHYTGTTFEQLFPNPYSTSPQPIKLNLNSTNSVPVSRVNPNPAKEIKQAPIQPPAPAPSTEFKIEDVYDGGLPPEDSNAF